MASSNVKLEHPKVVSNSDWIAARKEFAALTDGDAASPHDRIVGAFEVLRAKNSGR